MRASSSSGLSVLLCALLLPVFALADDWPQWRGPKRDGVWREKGIIRKLETPQIPIRWSVELGGGFTSPSVCDGRVYVSDRLTEPVEVERILCFDAKTGKRLWEHSYECDYNFQYPCGPRASISIYDGRAYSLGAMGHCVCLDAVKGTVLWQRDLNREYRIRMPTWGISAAPLVDGDLVILQIGGCDGACLVALDRKTGEERWRALGDRCSYSAPIIFDVEGNRVLVCWTGDGVAGLDPRSGKVHWHYPFRSDKWADATGTPILDRGRLFFSGFVQGSLLLQLAPDGRSIKELWKRRGKDERHTVALHSLIPTPILDGDYIYGIDSYGEIRCLDAGTGDRVWENLDVVPNARWGTAHLIRHEDKVWMFNETGELLITHYSPKGLEVISRSMLIQPTGKQAQRKGGVCWAHPAFANRHVFARSQSQLLCASLAAD